MDFLSPCFWLIIWMVIFPVDILLTSFFRPISDNRFSLQIIAAAGTSGRPRTFKKVSIIHSISSIHTFTFIVSFILTLQRSYESKFISTLNHGSVRHSPCSAVWSWRLELEWCERKTLLPGWWLEAGAEGMWERFTVALEAPASSRTRWSLRGPGFYFPTGFR